MKNDTKQHVCDKNFNKNFNPIWTLPQWKSRWSKTYFPKNFGNNDQNCNELQEEMVYENHTDPLNLFSNYEEELTAPDTSMEQRSSFTNWSILRLKTGSMDLAVGENTCGDVDGGEVVCQNLKRKDL